MIRSKDHKVPTTTLLIFIDGPDVRGKGIRASERLLQQYLPDVTASLLGSVIILGQGLPQKFTNNTPSGRKEVLEKLSKSDFMIEDLKTRVAVRKSELATNQRVTEDSTLELTTQKNILQSQIQQSEAILNNLDSDKLSQQLSEQLKLKQDIEAMLAQASSQCDELTQKVHNIVTEQSVINSRQSTDMSEAKTYYDSLCEVPMQSYNTLKAKLTVYNDELTRIRSIKDICPTCGQKITSVHKPDTTELEQNIADVSKELQEVSSILDKNRLEYDTILKTIHEKYKDKKSELVLTETSTSAELNKLKSSIRDYEVQQNRAITTIAEIEKQIAQLQSSIDLHHNIIRDNNEKLRVIEEKILYNIMQKDLIQSHLEVISKFDTALKRDFRGYLLSTVISYIEQRAQYYSNMIFDNTAVKFCLDGNNIDISYMDRAYENLSGGEKQKIDLIIQFSIRDMLSTQLGFTSNILVLDEVFDGLDSLGCTKVIDMIASVSDIKNIFIVTHRKDLSIPSDKELIVVKSSAGISEIK